MIVITRLQSDWEKSVQRISLPTLHRITDQVEIIARANVARHTRSGELLASVHSTKSDLGGRVWIGTDHWTYIEYGTPPHIITPRVKQALWWRGALHPVKRVHHPGTVAYAPMQRALEAVRW